jgi:hypothetical protein
MLSLNAQEYLENLRKSSVVVVKIPMLYLLVNNLGDNLEETFSAAGSGENITFAGVTAVFVSRNSNAAQKVLLFTFLGMGIRSFKNVQNE